MKKLYSLFTALVLAVTVNAQTTIYSENMGTGATGNPVVNVYTGYQNSSPVTYGGTADVRTTGASTGYTGASGNNCIFFAAAAGKTFIINGLDTSAATSANLTLTFGYASSQASKNLSVEVSTDGTNWTNIANVTNANTNWALKSATGVPSSATLSLRFTAVDASSGGLRIDDVKITSSTTLAVGDVNATKAKFVKNTVVDNNILFSAKADVKVVSMNGQVVKSASVNENTSLNVAELPKGMYIVTGVVNGKAVSEKIIKK